MLKAKVTSKINSLEPIGGAKPKFSLNTESLRFTREALSSVSLLCPAQGSPIPSYRLVEKGIVKVLGKDLWCQEACPRNSGKVGFVSEI